jgi:hypothetical protein
VTSSNGKRHAWRLVLKLPPGYEDETPALFAWLRDHVIPALLAAPVRVTLSFEPPDDVPPDRPSP